MLTQDELDDMFTYHAPHGDQIPRYAAINDAAKAFAQVVLASTKPCADQTHAIRVIRDARMWANAAIALEK
jgi:hypothetical protein